MQCLKDIFKVPFLTSGISWGSTLEPPLFNIHINNFYNIITHFEHLLVNYTDDTNILLKSNNTSANKSQLIVYFKYMITISFT